MMDKKSKISINLSSAKDITVKNVFVKWAFQAGRAIVVLVELIALIALGYRFIVDRQVVDLHEEIETQANIVEFNREKEIEFRGIHERLSHIKIINEETSGKIEIMNEIISSISEGEFTETDFSINRNSISFSGNSPSVFTIENFANRIQEHEQVLSISIGEINSSSRGVRFEIRIELTEMETEA